MLFLLLPVSAFAGDTVRHSSKEANFSLELESSWDNMTVTKTKQGKNTAWKADFKRSTASGSDMPLAMLVIDGRKSEDVKQTSDDFKNGQAEVLMMQIVGMDKDAGSKDGFLLTVNEIKKYGTRSFILIKKENRSLQAVRYYILTAFDNYIYSINCQAEVKTFADEQVVAKNLELMMRTLSAYRKG